MITLGIVVPVHHQHFPYLPRLLNSINANSALPTVVSISCSGVRPDHAILHNIIKTRYSFPIIWSTTHQSNNAATNRNIAAEKLDTDIISMMDADDLAYKQRNEYILKAFTTPNTNIVLHNLKWSRDPQLIKTNNWEQEIIQTTYKYPEIYYNYLDTFVPGSHFPIPATQLHTGKLFYGCGHISVTRELYRSYRYNEDPSLAGAEDSWYLYELTCKGHKATYIHNQLVLYTQESVPVPRPRLPNTT